LLDPEGTRDRAGYELHATVIARSRRARSAAQLVMGKPDGVPAAVISGSTQGAKEAGRDW